MNVDTGELKCIAVVSGGGSGLQKTLKQVMAEGFTPVPKKYQEEAEQYLAGKESVFVDMSVVGPLTDWANRERGRRGKMKKSQWAKARKVAKKEARK